MHLDCNMYVTCNGTVFTGKGLIRTPSTKPHVMVDGKIEGVAKLFEKALKRRVTVPPELRGKTIRRRRFEGTQEQFALALGLKVGPRRRRASAR